MIVVGIILALLFPIAFVFRNSAQFHNNSKGWHSWQLLIQIIFYVALSLKFGWEFLLFGAFLFWLVFDAGINIGMGKKITYIGQTAQMDKIARKVFRKGWIFVLFKALLLGGSIALLFRK